MVGRAMKRETKQQLDELGKKSNAFKFLKLKKKDRESVEGPRCMRAKGGRICFIVIDRSSVRNGDIG